MHDMSSQQEFNSISPNLFSIFYLNAQGEFKYILVS